MCKLNFIYWKGFVNLLQNQHDLSFHFRWLMIDELETNRLQAHKNKVEPMPIVKIAGQNPLVDGRQSENALSIQRGMSRYLFHCGHVVIPEFPLANGRRADLLSLDRKGMITVIEIKSSIEDFKVDKKWPDYRPYCDRFAFATLPSVPIEIFPEEEGLYIADNFSAELLREPVEDRMPPASRKALTLRFARIAAQRNERVTQYALTHGYTLPTNDDEE